MPGARWFPGATLNYAEHALAAGDDPSRRRRGRRAQPDPRAAGAHVGRAGRRGGAVPRRAACASASDRATGWPRTCRTSPRPLVAFLATASLGAIWSSCAPEFGIRSVVDRFAQIEPVGAARRRRLPVRREGRRQARRRRGDRGCAARRCATRCTCAYLGDGADDWTALLAEPGPLVFDAGPVRPSALRAVQLGHDRAAEGDRARARRHHRRAPQDAPRCTTTSAPATASSGSPPPGWMMWNYLMSGPAGGRDASCCSTATRAYPTSRRSGASRPTPASTCSA